MFIDTKEAYDNLIGFGYTEEEAKEQVKCIADILKGRVQEEDWLREAIQQELRSVTETCRRVEIYLNVLLMAIAFVALGKIFNYFF